MIDPLISQDVLRSLPHRPPFVMIDEIVARADAPPLSRFTIREDNVLLVDGYFSASGLVENMAQTAGAAPGLEVSSGGKAPQLGYIGAVKDLVIHELPRVGEMLETETVQVHQVMNALIVRGTVRCNGKLLASCELKIFLQS
jgi:predicted hotdog family 3-hydroxylacyl-ACP dehydratase